MNLFFIPAGTCADRVIAEIAGGDERLFLVSLANEPGEGILSKQRKETVAGE